MLRSELSTWSTKTKKLSVSLPSTWNGVWAGTVIDVDCNINNRSDLYIQLKNEYNTTHRVPAGI